MIRKFKKSLIYLSITCAFLAAFVLVINQYVQNEGSKYIVSQDDVPKADAIIVLGALVFPDGNVSLMLRDRLTTGYELYEKGKAPKIIVSGDHGQKEYDEVNTMKDFLKAKGVPSDDIFMDHAGFNTYDSLYRARDIFQAKKIIIVTQKYHLMRALFIAKELGIEAYGASADKRIYAGVMLKNEIREIGARNKAFFTAKLLNPKPKYLGEVIPVSGSGSATDDKKK